MNMVRTPLPIPARLGVAVLTMRCRCASGRKPEEMEGIWDRTVAIERVHRGTAREDVSVTGRVRAANVLDMVLEDAMM